MEAEAYPTLNLQNSFMRNILNIAHRGFTKNFPDNTLEAFKAAIELGVDGIEFDVHETADQKFVILHDAKLNGKDIAKLSLAAIEGVKLLGKFKVPTLEETLDLCRNRVKLLVEIKQAWSLNRFLTILRSKAELDDIVIASFNRDLISKLAQLAPEIRRGVITALPTREPVKMLESTQSAIIVAKFPFVDKKLVDEAHASNFFVYVWDCPDIKSARKVVKLGADGIVSDFPDLVMKEFSANARNGGK